MFQEMGDGSLLYDTSLWLGSLGLFAALMALGYLASRALMPQARFAEKLALGYGLGIGLLSWLTFIFSWIGFPLNRAVIVVGYLALVATFLLIRRFAPAAASQDEAALPAGWQRILDNTCWLLLAGFSVVLMLISVGFSFGAWDAMSVWSVKGYGMALEQTIFAGEDWGSKGLAYPLNLSLTVGMFFAFTRDLLPGSKLIFPGFLVAMLAVLRLYLYRLKIPAWLAWLAVLATASVPLILEQGLNGYANVPFAYYYVAGLLWIGLGIYDDDNGRLIIGGLLLALSGWTRIEGLEFWLIAMVGLLLVWRGQFLHKSVFARAALPGLVIMGIWVLFTRVVDARTTESNTLLLALQHNLKGDLHLVALVEIIRFTAWATIKQTEWGYVLPLVIALGLSLALTQASLRSDKLLIAPLVLGLLTALGVMLMYYFTSYDPQGLQYWLGTGYSRMLIGAVVLLATGSFPAIWRYFALTERPSHE